jgi:hypothetical protein
MAGILKRIPLVSISFRLSVAFAAVSVFRWHPGSLTDFLGAFVGSCATLLVGGVVAILLVEQASGILRGFFCPVCSDRALEFHRVASFGYRYYRCQQCGGLFKKVPFGPWRSAMAPEEAGHFRTKDAAEAGPALLSGGPDGGEGELVSSFDGLIRQKREREASPHPED